MSLHAAADSPVETVGQPALNARNEFFWLKKYVCNFSQRCCHGGRSVDDPRLAGATGGCRQKIPRVDLMSTEAGQFRQRATAQRDPEKDGGHC
jgi:hypothetical protein